MSVQLIVFPQYFDGSTPLSSPSNELVVDGINFNQVNTSSSTQSVSGALPQAFINSYTVFGFSLFVVNTWYRFSGVASEITQSSGSLAIPINTGIVQRLSNLTYGATYELTLNINSNTTQFTVYQYKGNQLKSSHIITGTGTQTISFNAYSTADVIVIYSATSVVGIADISCILSTSTPSGIFTDLSNGQVICDLYENEDIPLSLSVDDFKNVAEKVQSYSKAFNLPATKRNNQIFDNIFEITRTDNGLNFNPYKRTKAILKQDGFLLFEGYLRMLDISDKSGETSYNVNLYSEVVALADVLGDKTFSELDFKELEHEYQKTNIQYSWNDTGTGITYTNASTSGFRDTYSTVKYPFVDWTHQQLIGGSTGTGAISGNPEYTNLGQIFRPFINIKYLIDRIFQVVPFTYESEFFDTDDFKKLYMDFNWGSENAPELIDSTAYYPMYWYNQGTGGVANIATTSFTNMILNSVVPILGNPPPPNYNTSTHIITSTVANETYDIDYSYTIENTDSSPRTVECQWLYNSTPINPSGVITIAAGGTFDYTGTFTQIMTTVGDTLQVQFKASVGSVVRQKQDTSVYTASTAMNVGVSSVTTNTLLQTLRGETGQWEFLKGLLTMFNLVTLPDEDNPSNIKIEPYKNIFISSGDPANPNFFDNTSTELDWTDKIDVSEMKLMPLTDLNKKTIFKFVEDEDDFAFMNYKRQVGGHLYGSKKYDATAFTILAGEDEIIAEPFAATVVKPLEDMWSDIITPALYSMNDDETSEAFENSPRIMYNNGKKTTAFDYYIPEQNGLASSNLDTYLQFSHLTSLPPGAIATQRRDFHFGECQLIPPVGAPTNNNLFNLYWLPYYSELYNPDTRIMTIKVNLSPSDINTFKFNDTIFIKNRTFRVNKIDYKPNDLATVEFILIP
jgi:hypothetical protein